jgi:SAM-dependent methyltransferase
VGSLPSLEALYDAEHRTLVADIDLYLDLLHEARVRGPVVELACGSGRVAVPLARAGHRVTGLDLSAAMLRRARARRRALPPEASARLRFSQQDMRRFRFPQPFAAAIIPFSSLALLPEAADRAACLECTARHLRPHAPLVIDLPSPVSVAPEGGRRVVTSRFRLPRWGDEVEKVVEEVADPARGTTRVRYRYRLLRPGGGATVEVAETSFELARVERRQIEAQLYAAGFDVVAAMGDYRGTPHGPASPRLVLHAERLG